MEQVSYSIFNSLSLRYKEFDLKKSDIDRVGLEIETKIQAVLLGARGNGYRKFFSSTHSTSESTIRNESEQKKSGLLDALKIRKIIN
jgi:hypothetical protein